MGAKGGGRSRSGRRSHPAGRRGPPALTGRAAAPGGGSDLWARCLAAVPLLGVLAFGPFFRGLFFPGEQLVALAVIMAVFAPFWFYRTLRGYERPRLLEWAGLGLVLAYWAAVPTAVVPRAAVGEALKYSAYFMVLWMFIRLGDRERWRYALSLPLVAAALGVAVLGLGAAAGTFSYPGAFEGGRICSSLQYPNTAATYLTAGIILASGLAGWLVGGTDRGRAEAGTALPRWRGLVAAGLLAGSMAVMVLAFVFTLSRGGWVVFPFLLLLLAVLMPPGQRTSSLSVLGAALLGGLAAVPGLGRCLGASRGAVWTYTVLAFALGGLLGVVARLVLQAGTVLAAGPGGSRSSAIPVLRRVALGVAVALVAAGLVLVLARPGAVAALVPRQLRDRVAAINLSESGARDRIQWTRDALRLVSMRPVLGAGGGGWNALYGTVQTYPYFSTEVHNHYAQVWVEAGTLGLLAFLGVWGGLAWSYWRARRVTRGPAGGLLVAAFVAAVGLGAHAAIDFNLSLPAVAATLWALFGLVAAAEPVPQPRSGRRATAPWWLVGGVPLVTVAMLLLVLSLRIGHAAGQRGAVALNGGNVERALVEFEAARRYDPWTASFRIDLGQVYERLGRQSGAPALFEKARLNYQRGVALDPYNFQYRTLYGNFLLRQGEIEPALRELETAISCRPALAAGYENLAMACVRAALSPQVEAERARLYLERVERVADQMQRYSELAPAFARNRAMPPRTPRMVLARGEALLLRGDLDAARANLQEAAKQQDLKAEASLFLAVWARLAGQDPAPFLKDAAAIPEAGVQVDLIAARARTIASSP